MTALSADPVGILEWSSPARGRWIATGPKGLAGIIERLDDHYIVMAPDGHRIGRYRDLGRAQNALDPDLDRRRERRVEFAALVSAVAAAGAAGLAVWSMLR